jgi:hypothetical protein
MAVGGAAAAGAMEKKGWAAESDWRSEERGSGADAWGGRADAWGGRADAQRSGKKVGTYLHFILLGVEIRGGAQGESKKRYNAWLLVRPVVCHCPSECIEAEL